MDKLTDNFFLTIEKTIKAYRVFIQKKVRENGYKITIDQWLMIKLILENPKISQKEIGEKVFKDNASITRIIQLLIKSGFLKKMVNRDDKRKLDLIVTAEGISVFEKVQLILNENKKKTVENLSNVELENTNRTLNKIINNCNGSG